MPRGVPGPVVLKTKRKAPSTAFKPGGPPGPGRPKGCSNKFTGDVRDAILEGLNSSHPEGLVGFVRALAQESPTSASALLGRFVPIQSEVGKPGDFSKMTDEQVRQRIEERLRRIGFAPSRGGVAAGEGETSGAGRLN